MHLDIAFKTFVGLFAAIVMIGSGLGVITGFSKAVAAENYMESISKVIVESNFNTMVIDKCEIDATKRGYILEVNVKEMEKLGVKKSAELKLNYYFEIPLFGIKQEKVQWKVL